MPGYLKGGSKGGQSKIRYKFNFPDKKTETETPPPPKVEKCSYGPPRRKQDAYIRDHENFLMMWASLRNDDEPLPPVEKPKPKPPKPEMPKEDNPKRLLVRDIESHILTNTENHKTDMYECTEDKDGNVPELVIRRGNFVKFTITFDRPYDKEIHDMKLCFKIGKKTSTSKGTAAYIQLDEDGKQSYKPGEWGAYLESRSGNAIDIMVHVPADCIVGEWVFTVKTFSEYKDASGKEKMMIYQWKCEDDITMLFNPWCEHDTVYMEKQELLNEYILNESGAVWRGSKYKRTPKPWNFGQFESDVLDIVMYLLRKAFNTKKKVSKRMADPVHVSRKIVSILNSADNNGVLEGNWSGKYDDGISPLRWGESPRILRNFRKEGTVRYGQCWVFSCVTTAVFRCLGIPCRTVTNFASAHDEDGTNVIEAVTFRTPDGELMNMPGMEDSVWNFHVWNEVWFTRPDLKNKAYNGWQVVDATPQEKSGGVYTCGPCPVAAIKEGCVNVNYDAAFVFSEVNADRVWFKVHWDETVERTGLSTTSIGKFISTKYPDGQVFVPGCGDKGRLDLTSEYKYPEGSEQERVAVKKAYDLAFKKRKEFNPYKDPQAEEEVKLTISHRDDLMIGQNLEFEVTAKNMGFNGREILQDQITIAPKTYAGKVGKTFFKQLCSFRTLPPRTDDTVKIILTPEEYWPYLVEQAFLFIEVSACVSPAETGGSIIEVTKGRDFTFDRPDLEVKCQSEGKVGEPVEFEVSFKNPLTMKLTHCDISMNSSGFKDIEDKRQPDVDANGVYRETFTMIPKRKKQHTVNFTFDTRQLQDLTGSTSITIS